MSQSDHGPNFRALRGSVRIFRFVWHLGGGPSPKGPTKLRKLQEDPSYDSQLTVAHRHKTHREIASPE